MKHYAYNRTRQQIGALIVEAHCLRGDMRMIKKRLHAAQIKVAHRARALGWNVPFIAATLGISVRRVKKLLMMKES